MHSAGGQRDDPVPAHSFTLYASFCYLNRIQFGYFNRQSMAIVISPMGEKRAHSLTPPQVLTPDSLKAVELPLVRSSAKEIGLNQP